MTAARRTVLEETFRHDRTALAATLVILPLACWAWIVPMARDMYGAMTGPSAWMMTTVWDTPHVLLLLAMWIAMMAGMMLPSAAPVLLLYAGAVRHRSGNRAAARAVYAMTAGYLVVWIAFSAGATALQRALASVFLLSPMMTLTSARLSAALLIAAGAYQLTPLKLRCLASCSAPVDFLTRRWRREIGGFRLGLEHGVVCVGCCWALMLLLFVGGVMNIAVIGILTAVVLVEKLTRVGQRWVQFTGVALIVLGFAAFFTAAPAAREPSRNIVIVTIDGLRWQEVFTGANAEYFKKDSEGNPPRVQQRYMAATPEERRALLMPFLWNVMAKNGQVFGDPSRHSRAHVTNGLWFSYPGYSEMFAGVADPRVDSNDKVPNPNVTVLEWLNGRSGFRGRVAAFGAWDVFPFIFNTDRSRLPVGAGYRPVPRPTTERQRRINQLADDLPRYWDEEPFDAPVVYAGLEALRSTKPRVLAVMLGEGDDWAHEGRYDMYLDATVRADRFIERIWHTVQSLPGYKNNTTLLVTTDHGRGATASDWSDHGRDVPAAEDTWIAVLGPTVPPLGVRENITVTTSQIAATIAAAVGEDYRSAVPAAADALPFRIANPSSPIPHP
jgi:predicted metal-binding membrane protein